MKNSTIKDIFHGKKGSMDTMDVPPYKTARKSMLNYENEFKKQLLPKQLELFDKIIYLYEQDLLDEVDHYFTEGFKLGLRIGVECWE